MSRELTKEQFVKGGTIDGRRLNKAIKEIVSKLNQLDRGYIAEKWTEGRIVRNWRPCQDRVDDSWPWLRAFNTEADIYTGAGDQEDISNPHREKGYYTPGIAESDPDYIPGTTAAQYIWSESLYFSQPAILLGWDLFMLVTANSALLLGYLNDWVYGANDLKPEGVDEGDPRRDMSLHIAVDSPLDQEDRSLSSLVACKYEFSQREARLTQADWPLAGWVDGYPASFAQNPLRGLYVHHPLYIPIHANSRVRVSIVIPDHKETGGLDEHGGWYRTDEINAVAPWNNSTFNMTLGFLEVVENGKD